MRFFNYLAAQPWAITEECLRRMHEIYCIALERKANGEQLDRSALEKELGRPLDNTRAVTVRGGVATIPVEGPIFRRADMFTDVSGATTIETLAKDFNEALTNPAVKAIIFYIDSPGGEVNGINEFSDMVFAARGGDKPVVSYVAHDGASAACWIATSSEEVILDATASLGSIGIVAAVPDPNKQYKRDIEFVSSQSPKKRPDPTTEKGKAVIQDLVDSLAAVFVECMARNRGVTPGTVINDFGGGALLVGEQAVDAGLADRVGSYEQVLSELQAEVASGARAPRPQKRMHASLSGNGEKTMAESKDKNWLRRLLSSLSEDERQEATAALSESAEESEDVRQLRERAARYEVRAKEERIEAAKKFAGEQVVAKAIFPRTMEKLEALCVALAEADDKLSLTGSASLMAQVKAIFADLPKHNLTKEMAASDLPKGSVALNPDAGAENELLSPETASASARAYAERANNRAPLKEVK
ncbi:MAG TPA: S49 family peptidase [Pyrinomonadaceae bacterium]|jgi:ClpP class serine protease